PTSGTVVGADGFVVSSAFNFRHRPASILVQLADGTRKPARLVATDHSRMLVLLKIEVDQPLVVPEMTPGDEMRVGQWTIAVGRTFEAARPNVAVGVLSARNRVWGKAIQTDAAVSPNNYGGPLVDVRGRVLGILVPLSPKGGDEVAGFEWYDSGIAFAVPGYAVAAEIVPRLKTGEDLRPGLLGITLKKGNLSIEEPVLAGCRPNSPAAEAGLKTGDRIVQIDGQPIVRAAQIKEALGRLWAGDTVALTYKRGDDEVKVDAIELAAELIPYEHAFLGILPMRPAADDPASQGVVVRYVYPGSPAEEATIVVGDVLVALAGKPVVDLPSFDEQITAAAPDDEVTIDLRRGDAPMQFTVTLGRLPEALPPDDLPPARPSRPAYQGDRPDVGKVALKVPELPNDAWAYVPADYDPAVAHGVVVWLHGPEGLEPDKLIALWKPLCDRYDLILLAPKAADPASWKPTELTLVGKLLDEVVAGYTVDAARIVAGGRQGGGRLAYRVALEKRDLVRGVATVDAAATGRPSELDAIHRLAFYLATSEKSDAAKTNTAAAKRLREMKYPVTAKDLGEAPRALEDDERAELARWIDMLDRK
ncbi:MAG: PDZ domain-containing protein, partial [Planctomycetes bacterium]|nr:PDZ domain-containing protein [Planctomycetota bacterium]